MPYGSRKRIVTPDSLAQSAQLRAEAAQLAESIGRSHSIVRRVVLFGSVANGKARRKSDKDLGLVLDDSIGLLDELLLKTRVRSTLRHEGAKGVHLVVMSEQDLQKAAEPVTVVRSLFGEARIGPSPFWENIHREGQELYRREN